MRPTLVAATVLATLLATPLLPPPVTADGAAEPTTSPRLAESRYQLYLDFDGNPDGPPDLTSSGSATVDTEIASAEGGTVVAEPKDDGQVARFEPFDPETPAELGVVVVRPTGDRDPFAPRRKPFVFGAMFNLDAQSEGSSVDNGNNLIQRGLYADDAQYKIQLDHDRLSCRVAGAAGSVLVRAGVEVRTGRWHRVRCIRDDRTVRLVLIERTPNGPVTRSWARSGAIGRLLFARNPPLSVGGKIDDSGGIVTASADQFNGRVDNVFFRRTDG